MLRLQKLLKHKRLSLGDIKLAVFITSFFDAVRDKNKAVMDDCLDSNYISKVMNPDILEVTSSALSDFYFYRAGKFNYYKFPNPMGIRFQR